MDIFRANNCIFYCCTELGKVDVDISIETDASSVTLINDKYRFRYIVVRQNRCFYSKEEIKREKEKRVRGVTASVRLIFTFLTPR